MLKRRPNPLVADQDDRAFGADPALSGSHTGEDPKARRDHSLLWWVLVIIAIIL
jgi:hypothetical protein